MRKCLLKLQTRSKIVVEYALHWLSMRGKLYLRGIPQLLLVGLLLSPIVYFSNRVIETILQIIALFALRYKFDKTYHAKTIVRCTFLTLGIGYIAIFSLLPIRITLFHGIAIGFAIAFLSWLAQEFIDRKHITPKFSLNSCTRDEFVAYCLDNGIRTSRVGYVWDVLRSEMTTEEICEKYVVEPETVKQDRWRYRKKLAKPIDK